MGTYNSAVITNGGQSMIAQAVAGASLEFTTIKTSNYAYPAGTNLATLTTINGIKQSKDITSATVYNSRVIKISAAVDNTGISTAYTINAIGIYAKVGSSAESLFAVVTASAADTMPAYSNKPYSYIYEINLTMQNAANMTVTVNAAGLVNVADLNAAKFEIQGEIADLKSALNTVCQANSIVIPSSGTYFIPFEAKSGDVIEITAGANGINVWSQNSSSQNVDEKWVSANTTVTLTLSADIARFKIYTSAASSALFINTSIGILPDYLDKIDLNTANILTCVKGIKRINNTNYSTDLSNLNNAEKNSIYILVFGSTNPITNYPGSPEGSLEFLFTFGVPGSDYKTQMLFKSEWQILKRKYVSSWTDWQIISKPRIIHIGPGQEFTTLKAGIARAIQFNGTKVIVHPKENNAPYDLTSEFATEIAADQTGVKFGNKLENDVHIIFETGAKVTALCTNVSENITTYFNPFYAGTDGGGYTLENLDIDASNTRYCLHDEAAAATTPRTVKILNCKMVFDNRTAAIDWYGQCLGGGLGINDYIEIRGCYFDSKRRSQPSSTAGEIASYHNNGVASHAVSRIVVSDCYFAGKGTFKFSYWGTTEEISEGIINNCSLGSGIIVRQEQSQNPSPENIDVLEFNNVVRN